MTSQAARSVFLFVVLGIVVSAAPEKAEASGRRGRGRVAKKGFQGTPKKVVKRLSHGARVLVVRRPGQKNPVLILGRRWVWQPRTKTNARVLDRAKKKTESQEVDGWVGLNVRERSITTAVADLPATLEGAFDELEYPADQAGIDDLLGAGPDIDDGNSSATTRVRFRNGVTFTLDGQQGFEDGLVTRFVASASRGSQRRKLLKGRNSQQRYRSFVARVLRNPKGPKSSGDNWALLAQSIEFGIEPLSFDALASSESHSKIVGDDVRFVIWSATGGASTFAQALVLDAARGPAIGVEFGRRFSGQEVIQIEGFDVEQVEVTAGN